jgi:predicted RNA-binding protein YlqC (UPF0109 family)
MTYEPAFFPANAGATPIVLGAGQEVDVPFRLRLVNAGTLEVTVPPSEERGRVLEQDLVIANPDGVRVELEARKGYRDRVVTLDLAAGEYEVALVMSEGGRRLHASRTVPVSAVETRLALEPMVSPVVRVRVEASGQVPAGLTLTHMKTGQVTAQALGVGQQAEFADLPPGEYRLGLGGGQAYLKGVFDGEKQLPDGRFRLERAPVELMAKTGSTPGEVRGVVLQDQRVAPGMLVALVPLDQVEDSRRYRGYQTDSDGSFRFANVPPGEYGLLVSENPRLEFALAATLQPLLERAVKVTVTAKGSVTLELEARP